MSLVPVSNEELGIKVKALDEDLKIIKRDWEFINQKILFMMLMVFL